MSLMHRNEEIARLFDSSVGVLYTSHFLKPLVPLVPLDARNVLDIACGTGQTAMALLGHLGNSSRVVAVDEESFFIDWVRRKNFADSGKRLFLKSDRLTALSFGESVFDAAIGNRAFELTTQDVLKELRRVLVPGGKLLLSGALRGSGAELLELVLEHAVSRSDSLLRAQVDAFEATQPEAATLKEYFSQQGFTDVTVTQETVRLPFANAAELFADRMVDALWLARLRTMFGADSERILEDVEHRLETYAGGGPVSLTLEVGVVSAVMS